MAIKDFFSKKKQGNTEEEERYILSIDGGGMRGIIPAIILEKISQLMEEMGDNRPFYSHFDLISGTSTGGLIALSLSIPIQKSALPADTRYISYIYEKLSKTFMQKIKKAPASEQLKGTLPLGVKTSDLESLYAVHGKEIFPKSQGRIFSQIFTDKYDAEPLERYLKKIFRDVPLSEAQVPVMVMTYDAANGRPFPISSRDSHGFLFWEAGRATSAAPTYFKPAFLFDREEQTMQTLIDGGMVANNPSLYAYCEAKKLYPNAKKFHILSLSTASSDFTFTISGSGTGVIGWIDPAKGAPIQRIYANAQVQTTDVLAQEIPDLSYTRVHGPLDDALKLDAISPSAINLMREGALTIYRENEEKIRAFATLLTQRTTFDQLTLGPKEIEPLLVAPEPDSEETPEEPEELSPSLSPYYTFLNRYGLTDKDSNEGASV
ncbi:patatin-like phospholipase family protein [uncultured Sphaerochaeta sp.]|uniref:patatin-like phospholipase family protein n=1 Tax=uncultured Sphaerochaeta sp. TaxID=886478 RepID=UPI002A0A28BE|nr:patatin-like phospholipase family protein [uncultured Sphaerochaeta sp.]